MKNAGEYANTPEGTLRSALTAVVQRLHMRKLYGPLTVKDMDTMERLLGASIDYLACRAEVKPEYFSRLKRVLEQQHFIQLPAPTKPAAKKPAVKKTAAKSVAKPAAKKSAAKKSATTKPAIKAATKKAK